jgi:ribonuclease P/MRP protein subunit POP5
MVRFKNRYFLLSIELENEEIVDGLSQYTLQDSIKDSIELLFGEFGMVVGQAVSVKYYSPYSGTAIVRTSRDYYKLVWAAISFVNTLKNRRCSIRVIHTSGTIKLLQKSAIQHDKLQIKRIQEKKKVTEKKAQQLLDISLHTLQKLE